MLSNLWHRRLSKFRLFVFCNTNLRKGQLSGTSFSFLFQFEQILFEILLKSYWNLIEILFLCNHIVVGTWTNFTVGFTLDVNKLMHSHSKTFSNSILNVATLIKGKTPVSDSLFVSDFVWEIFKKLIIISGCNWNQSTQLRITRGGKPYDQFICPHWRRSKTNYWRSSKI